MIFCACVCRNYSFLCSSSVPPQSTLVVVIKLKLFLLEIFSIIKQVHVSHLIIYYDSLGSLRLAVYSSTYARASL
jgi:hypothetical protein